MESNRPNYSSRKSAPLDQFEIEGSGDEKLPDCNTILWFGIISVLMTGLIGIILGVQAVTKSKTALNLYDDHPEKYTEKSLNAVKWGRGLSIFGFAFRGLVLLIVLISLAFAA